MLERWRTAGLVAQPALPGETLVAELRTGSARREGRWTAQVRSRADVLRGTDPYDTLRTLTDWYAEPLSVATHREDRRRAPRVLHIALPVATPPSEDRDGVHRIRPELRILLDGEPVASTTPEIRALPVHDGIRAEAAERGWSEEDTTVCRADAARRVRVRWESTWRAADEFDDLLPAGFGPRRLRFEVEPQSATSATVTVALTSEDAHGERRLALVGAAHPWRAGTGWTAAVIEEIRAALTARPIRPPATPDPPGPAGRSGDAGTLSTLADEAPFFWDLP